MRNVVIGLVLTAFTTAIGFSQVPGGARLQDGFVVPSLPEGLAYYHDLPIGKGGSVDLFIDICAPATDPGKRLPVLAVIHGGGWNKGSKNDHAKKIVGFAERGYVGVSIQYRLTPSGAVFPAQIQDVKLAIRYLRAHAGRFFIDQERIGVWGSSAGGHLAALLGSSAGVAEFEGTGGWEGFSSRVQAVVDFSGPADFTTSFADNWSSLTRLLGSNALAAREQARKAMPGTWADRNDPPFLILHGNEDTVVPHQDSVVLAKQLREAGVDVVFGLVGGAGHSMSSYPWTSELAWQFLDFHLKQVGAKPVDPPAPTPQPARTPRPSLSPDAANPLAWWSFNDDPDGPYYADSSAGGLHLKPNTSGGISLGEGVSGGAIHLQDGFSYLSNRSSNTEDNVRALNLTSSMSVEFWLKLDELPAAYMSGSASAKILYKVNSGTKSGYELYVHQDGSVRFKLWQNSTTRYEASSGKGSLAERNRWYHIAATYDGQEISVYIDGVLKGSTKWEGGAGDAGAYDLRIGATSTNTASPSSGLKGWLDELRIYNTALPEATLREHFLQRR